MKSNCEFKLIQVSSAQGKILIKLITPRRKIRPAIGVRIQSEKKVWRIFTASEVFEFVEEVGDKNKIYRFNPPIVPGLLILETLLQFAEFFSCEFLRLRFKHFITAGEPLTLSFKDENNFEICSAGSTKILGCVENGL